jgi:sugar phosphate isomerase/epimerase
MGVGYTTIMYGEESLLDGIADIGACRSDGVETSLGEIDAVGADAFEEQLSAYNLDLYCAMGEWLETQDAADRIAAGAETAADLGAPYLGILPPHRGTTDDDDFERWLGDICDAAADADITPVLHHHGGPASNNSMKLKSGSTTPRIPWDCSGIRLITIRTTKEIQRVTCPTVSAGSLTTSSTFT